MDEMLYVAMTGAKQTEYAQAINSNNLANISTTGFRADLHSFSSVPVDGPGVETRVNAVVDSYGTDFSPGPVTNTGRDLDVAIEGRGYIAVQAPDVTESSPLFQEGPFFEPPPQAMLPVTTAALFPVRRPRLVIPQSSRASTSEPVGSGR